MIIQTLFFSSESPLNVLNHSNSNLPPHLSLPTEPEPPEMVLKEEVGQGRPEWDQMDEQSNQSDYDINQEMYQESQDLQHTDDDQFYQGSQVILNA